jgi:hypothetical protein
MSLRLPFAFSAHSERNRDVSPIKDECGNLLPDEAALGDPRHQQCSPDLHGYPRSY